MTDKKKERPQNKNLKPFPKGVVHKHKGGRKQGSRNLSTILRDALSTKVTLKDETKTTAEWIIQALISKAGKGDIQAIREIMDRMEGKATQRTEITGADGSAIEVKKSEGLRELDARLVEIIEQPENEVDSGDSEA